MRPVMDSYEASAFAIEPFTCPRCRAEVEMRFPGLCPTCVTALRTTMRGEAQVVDAEYVPKMNVTVNAVALRDD